MSKLTLADIKFGKVGDYVKTSPLSYPTSEAQASALSESDADSVIVAGGDPQLPDGKKGTAEYWQEDPVTCAKIKPLYPKDSKFWEEMKTVVDVQLARKNCPCAIKLPKTRWPDIWKDKDTLEKIAEAVNGEYPASIQATFIETVYKNGGDVLELGQFKRGKVDFISKQVRQGALNTFSFQAVAPVNFMMKWYYGVPRPEEVAFKISKGDLTADSIIDQLSITDPTERAKIVELVSNINSMNLCSNKGGKDFTAYAVGSPTHPAFPAMHSAGSTCSLWLPALFDITPEQYCEALRVDYATSYGRTVAGVHYEQDNIAGLNIGQRIMREELPEFLANQFGYDACLMKKRLETLSFDWNTFQPGEGSKDCKISVGGEEMCAVKLLEELKNVMKCDA